jgi:lipopolysaccharide export system protein LptA
MTAMRMRLPRFTIERLRTLVLIGAVLLVAAIAVFLALERLRLRKQIKDLPSRLGIDIQQQANGVDYTQTRKGKTLFKIHAARAVQLKIAGRSILHDVRIDLYGDDGQRTDTISGSEFEYDPSAGLAHAAGAVEITLMRPGARPAIAQLKPGAAPQTAGKTAFPTAPEAITDNEIHVKTSGLTFNQKTQVATTEQRVDFVLRQGKGNAIGATYSASHGELVLNHAVELIANRDAAHAGSEPVTIHAAHGEFHRKDQQCTLQQARAEYTGGTAQAADALIDFRDDGSVQHMQGSGGVELTSKGGADVTAPRGTLDFDEHNHPRTGLLEGGTQLAMNQPARRVQGSAATAHLHFDGKGDLHQAHLEQNVVFHAWQQGKTAKGSSTETTRTWNSQTADIDFATTGPAAQTGAARAAVMNASNPPVSPSGAVAGRTEPRVIHGFGGVTVTSETHVDGHILPSKLSADTVVAELAPGSVLSNLTGNGHAHFEQQTAQGVHQSSSSDQLDVHFLPTGESGKPQGPQTSSPQSGSAQAGSSQIDVMHQSGHVVLIQEPAPAKPGQAAQSPVHATADRSDYDGKTEILHLEGSPRVENGALEMTAARIDFARGSGDVFAHGNVKASWANDGKKSQSVPGATLLGGSDSSGAGSADAAGNGPVHAVAAEAEMHQGTQEVVLRAAKDASGEPRMWQAGSSVTAPVIVLNRQKMTLQAQAGGAASPVVTVLVGHAAAPQPGRGSSRAHSARSASEGKPGAESPSTIRIRSGDLRYSDGERLALFHAGVLGSVTASTVENGSPATVVSQQAEVHLTPAGARAGAAGSAGTGTVSTSSGSVDTMTASGRVTVDWPGRHGTGEKLVYLSDDGSFTLTGTAAVPPRMTDRDRGTVTGRSLIYHSREDVVMVEGDGARTSTDTRSPK